MDNANQHIADIRTDYRLAALDESMVGDDPLPFFRRWFGEAEAAAIYEVNAMTLATVDENSTPHARIVLLKGLDEKGFTFFTNYQSAKGHELVQQPKAALVFFWKELERQVRIEGIIEKLPVQDSDEYFQSRPKGSRIGAWASPQSEIIPDRSILDNNVDKYVEQFKDAVIPRPDHWGGYRLVPDYIEFWQGRSNRLHDRIVFRQNEKMHWDRYRLAP